MKKFFILLPVLALILTGCGEKKEDSSNNSSSNSTSTNKGTITCTLNNVVEAQDLAITSEYIIHYDGEYAEYAETTETIISNSQAILNAYETTLKETYDEMNDAYGGYTVNITNENGKLISKVKVDYEKMDLKKLVSEEPTMSSYVIDNHMSKSGLQTTYETMGATCK